MENLHRKVRSGIRTKIDVCQENYMEFWSFLQNHRQTANFICIGSCYVKIWSQKLFYFFSWGGVRFPFIFLTMEIPRTLEICIWKWDLIYEQKSMYARRTSLHFGLSFKNSAIELISCVYSRAPWRFIHKNYFTSARGAGWDSSSFFWQWNFLVRVSKGK